MQLTLEPFYLIDECLSPSFATVFSAVGFKVTNVRNAFKGRQKVDDHEIIEWLEHYGQHQAVWVTEDMESQKIHAKLILAKNISVLWILNPKKWNLTGLQELQLLSLTIERVTHLISNATSPVYLQASLVNRRPKLEKLISPLTDKKLVFERVSLH